MSVSDNLEAATNDMIGRDKVKTKVGTRAAPVDAEVFCLTKNRTSSGKAKTNGKIQDDKEVTKRNRRNVQPAVINNDGTCFSKNGQYRLDMRKRSELYAASEKWIKTLCIQNKVWFLET